MVGNFKLQSINMELRPRASWQELLIELVRDRPCLYDKSHRDYFDTRGVKKNQWKDVAAGLIAGGCSSIGDANNTQSGKRKIHILHLHLLDFYYHLYNNDYYLHSVVVGLITCIYNL